MLDADTLLQQRFRNRRPGLELIAIEDAALPVTVVGTDVLAQERKALPLLDEFVLRFTDAGLSSVDAISAFLGLEPRLVESTVADQARSDNISRGTGIRPLILTPRGKRSVQELEAVQPVEKQLPVTFDRLTWSVADYSRNELIARREAEELGMLLLPASRTSRISVADLTASALNALLAGRAVDRPRFEILNVRKVRPNTHRLLPVKLLIYGDVERGEVQLAVSVDGDLSQKHELALNALGGAERLGIRVAEPVPRPVLGEEIEAARVTQAEVSDLRSATIAGRLEAARVNAPSISRLSPGTSAEQELSDIPVRSVSMLEHRELLQEALEAARLRILILSPWIKSAVVDTSFLGRLERRIRAGVRVFIAHGFGADDRGSDARALERLGNLQRRYRSLFTLARLPSTHAKVLIFDDTWISTSFNWLSFRGDPDRTYRIEEGTLVRLAPQVDAEFKRYVALIEDQRIDTNTRTG
ncbi:hypothetical protein ACWCO3_00380 [Micromonospora sp. NPDC002411]